MQMKVALSGLVLGLDVGNPGEDEVLLPRQALVPGAGLDVVTQSRGTAASVLEADWGQGRLTGPWGGWIPLPAV